MRDPNRLDNFYITFNGIHKDYFPDWRFGQLIVNFINEYGDPFYFEENKMLDKLREFATKYGCKR